MKSPLFQYDQAVYNLIHSLYDVVVFASPEECFSRNAKMHKGKVVMPFISIWRLPDFSINTEMANDSFLRRGYPSRTTASNGIEFPNQRVAMHGLPVTLQYQLDVYATKRDVCDGLTAELMMYLKENPWINVQIMDMGEKVVQFNFDLEDSVMDNTDISGFDETNRFYRLTLTANIIEAVIYRIDTYEKVQKVYLDYNTMVTGETDEQPYTESEEIQLVENQRNELNKTKISKVTVTKN